MAKRLLDDHAAPEPRFAVRAIVLFGELRLAKLLHHCAEELICDREVKDDVALSAMRLLSPVKNATKFLVELGFRQVALDICHLLRKLLPHRVVDVISIELGSGVADKALQHAVKVVAPAFCSPLGEGNAD